MDAHDAVLNFRDFLLGGYAAWRRSASVALEFERGFLDEAFYDWAQSNWELLVERPLCRSAEYLEIYGPGSDYEAKLHSRVFFHDAVPTHAICCVAATDRPTIDVLSGLTIDPTLCAFDRLVARVAGWHDDSPPFDHVLLRFRDTDAMVPMAVIRFELRSV